MADGAIDECPTTRPSASAFATRHLGRSCCEAAGQSGTRHISPSPQKRSIARSLAEQRPRSVLLTSNPRPSGIDRDRFYLPAGNVDAYAQARSSKAREVETLGC